MQVCINSCQFHFMAFIWDPRGRGCLMSPSCGISGLNKVLDPIFCLSSPFCLLSLPLPIVPVPAACEPGCYHFLHLLVGGTRMQPPHCICTDTHTHTQAVQILENLQVRRKKNMMTSHFNVFPLSKIHSAMSVASHAQIYGVNMSYLSQISLQSVLYW